MIWWWWSALSRWSTLIAASATIRRTSEVWLMWIWWLHIAARYIYVRIVSTATAWSSPTTTTASIHRRSVRLIVLIVVHIVLIRSWICICRRRSIALVRWWLSSSRRWYGFRRVLILDHWWLWCWRRRWILVHRRVIIVVRHWTAAWGTSSWWSAPIEWQIIYRKLISQISLCLVLSQQTWIPCHVVDRLSSYRRVLSLTVDRQMDVHPLGHLCPCRDPYTKEDRK